MIRSVAYFPLQCALNSGPVMSAVLSALQTAGINTDENSWRSDAAIIWSVLWHGRMAANKEVHEHYRKQNKPVIVVDVGTLHRDRTWKLAINNITADGYYGHTENLDWDRPKKLGITLGTAKTTNPGVLIAAQHRKSLAIDQLTSVEQWVNDQAHLIRQHTTRPIIVRSHPRSQLNPTALASDIILESPQRVLGTYDSYDFKLEYHAVVNYNSGPGILAAIAGTRPLVDSSSLAYPVGVKYSNLECPYSVDRQRWLVEICHTEYTIEELATGSWIARTKLIAPV